MGTLKVTEAFTPHVAASRQKKIITLGSAAGSIQMLNDPPDFYAYRASKAALHLLMPASLRHAGEPRPTRSSVMRE